MRPTPLGVAMLALLLPTFPAAASAAPNPPPPVRSPTAPGTPPLIRVPGTGQNPPPDQDGDYLIAPPYVRSPDLDLKPGVPQGTVYRLALRSQESRFYPGITWVRPGSPAEHKPANLADLRSYPRPWVRTVTVYVPSQYRPGAPAPILVVQDGPETLLPPLLDNLIAQGRIPALVAIMIQNGGGDAQGSERGLEYDTVSGRYAEWVEAEVIPRVERDCNVVVTRDPEGRAAMGGSSGAAAAFTMAWFHPEWCRRVLSYSGTFVNQAWPPAAATPHGAWEYHARLIPESPPKTIRIWMEVGDQDLLTSRDGYHDWVDANNRMAVALRAKGYHYQYVFAVGARHVDWPVRQQTLPEALEWVWRGYRPAQP